WARLFTPDGQYEGGPYKTKGYDALSVLPKPTATATSALHLVTNVIVESTPEGARGGAYMIQVVPGESGKPATTTVVVYEDLLVKTSEGWRIKSRKTHTSDAGLAPSLMFGPK